MATASIFQALGAEAQHERTRLGWRDNFITLVTATWLMIGLFVDGWAHNNIAQLETFFTPWHAIFYSGFLACGWWTGFLVLREWRTGKSLLGSIPQGYHLGVLGVCIFGLGGLGDMTWHIVFGVEQNIAALLSPTHLLLFLGGSLIFASPFLAAWISPHPAEDAPRFVHFLPTLGSLTMMTSFASFMHMYLWAIGRDPYSTRFVQQIATRYPTAVRPLTNYAATAGLSSILITNVVLLVPVLLLLRRWRIPPGSVTFLFTINTVLMTALGAFRSADMIVVMLLAGGVADTLIQLIKPWRGHVARFRAVAVLIPLVMWTLYFGAALISAGIAWALELTAGITVMAALSGFALSLIMAPPAIPTHVHA